tara:strand:+ start:31863 stop:33371 length:1509 start_codon:yes stop_codon:yes gene_type:complete
MNLTMNMNIRIAAMTFCLSVLCAFSSYGQSIDWIKKAKEAVEAAIPEAEKDPTRPLFHFRPPAQWMNDICGTIYYNGYYHAFYQYNPFSGDSWGDDYTLWAHARSKDLTYWEDLPWSFIPMKEQGERRCNSGSIALDGNGQPTILYTFVPEGKNVTQLGKREQWAVAPLDDDLIEWKRVGNDPVMAAGMNGIPSSINGGWSDPFVFKSNERTFVTFKESNGLVCEAMNKELTKWKFVGNMDGVIGECPNFFPLDDKWVLIRSTKPISYVVGDFDSKNISFNQSGSDGILDYGFGDNPPTDRSWTRGLYATNVFTDEIGRTIMLGWINGFKANRGWNGCMSLPRVLTLDVKKRLIQTPVHELKQLRNEHHTIKRMVLNSKEKKLEGIRGDMLEIITEFELGSAKAFGLKIRQSDDGKEYIPIRYDGEVLDVAGTKVTLDLPEGKLKLQVFIDKSVMEVFINDGVTSVSRVEYPGENNLGISVFAENGDVILSSFDAWNLKSIW